VTPSNGPSEWQERYDDLARQSRRIAHAVEPAE
jgi:formate dehydrogenase major subunit